MRVKNIIYGVILFILSIGAWAAQQQIDTISLGAQWEWDYDESPGQFVTSCDEPNEGGYSCIFFPTGGQIHAIQYQSSVKTGPHEVLFRLITSPDGISELEEQGGRILINTHHVSRDKKPTMRNVEMHFTAPATIPPGWYVWIRVRGSGAPHPAGVEIQTTLYGVWGIQPEIVRPRVAVDN